MSARLARVLLVVALLASWQAALQHPIEHFGHSHESGLLCDVVEGLTACAPDAAQPASAAEHPAHEVASYREDAPRVAEAPPFFSQGPPVAPV